MITPLGIARAYSRPAASIPVWLEIYGLLPVGYAENPETGKAVHVYRVDEVEKAFYQGHTAGRKPLRPYSGAWERGPIPAEKQPLSARERAIEWHAEQRRYREERDRREEERLAQKEGGAG